MNPARASLAPSTFVVLISALALGCGGAGRDARKPGEVSSGDGPPSTTDGLAKTDDAVCANWGAHFAKVAKLSFHENVERCAKKSSPKPKDATDSADQSFATAIDEQAKDLVDECRAQAGKTYSVADADCFTKAERVAAWGNCPFETPFFQTFTGLGKNFDRKMAEGCDE